MKRLCNKNITPACEYCAVGRNLKEKGVILCIKRGVVKSDFHCKKFKYNPLKRVPKSNNFPTEFNNKDFSI